MQAAEMQSPVAQGVTRSLVFWRFVINASLSHSIYGILRLQATKGRGLMQRYKNASGDSSVVAFEITEDSITVEFKGGIYLYTVASTGAASIAEMKKLALAGRGLGSYIARVVKKRYAKKLK